MSFFCLFFADSSKDERYKVARRGVYSPYVLTITNVSREDTGNYHCCLSSGCSVDVEKCQKFTLAVTGKVYSKNDVRNCFKLILLYPNLPCRLYLRYKNISTKLSRVYLGVANGTSKNVGLGKFWQDLEISEVFLISLEVSFFHGLLLLFLSLETFHQRVSGSDF